MHEWYGYELRVSDFGFSHPFDTDTRRNLENLDRERDRRATGRVDETRARATHWRDRRSAAAVPACPAASRLVANIFTYFNSTLLE